MRSTWSIAEWSVKGLLVCANTSKLKDWRCRFPLLYLGGIATLPISMGTGDPGYQKSSFLISLCCSPQSILSPMASGTGTPGMDVLWHWGHATLGGWWRPTLSTCWLKGWFDYSQKMGLTCLWLQSPVGAAGSTFEISGVLLCSCVILPAKSNLYQLNKKMC